MLTDTHCHLTTEDFKKDLDQVIRRAVDGGISKMITVGSDLESSREAVKLSEKYSGVYAAVGLHPEEALDLEVDEIRKEVSRLKNLAENKKVLAIGEIGIDVLRLRSGSILRQSSGSTLSARGDQACSGSTLSANGGQACSGNTLRRSSGNILPPRDTGLGSGSALRMGSENGLRLCSGTTLSANGEQACSGSIEKQKEALDIQLRLALVLNLPVIIHCRDAEKELFEPLDNFTKNGGRGVLHSFTGELEFLKHFLNLGWLVSFNGIITFKNGENVRELCKNSPLDSILIETDAPFLAPVPYRGKRCEPLFVIEVAKKVAEIKNVSLTKLTGILEENFRRVFM